MSISTKILADQFTKTAGFQAAPTDVEEDTSRTISGAGSDTRKDRGHKDLGQVIRRGVELLTRANTAIYQTNGDIDPGRLSAYVIRAESSTLNISLAKPPAVPDEQLTRKGKARERFWTVDVMIWHAVECTVIWPANCVFGRAGYKFDADNSLLSETSVPASSPRPTHTADFYRLVYVERTAEWVVEPVALAVAMSDPETAADDATEPKPDEDDGEIGTEEDPEYDYEDEDGNALTPEVPAAITGNLLAIHDGAVTVSKDGGATWRFYNDGPANPVAIAHVPKKGYTAVSDGKLYVSQNARNWAEIDLKVYYIIPLPFQNGDFETGDLTGWTLKSGDEPRVLDTNNPPQIPGSEYYLTRDWMIINPQNFELQQTVTVPELLYDTFVVSADVYAEEHAQASIKVSVDKGTVFDSDEGIGPRLSYNTTRISGPLNLIKIENPNNYPLTSITRFDPYFYWGSAGTWEEYLRVTISGWTGTITTPEPDTFPTNATDAKNAAVLIDFDYRRTKSEIRLELTNQSYPGEVVTLVIPEKWMIPIGRLHTFSDLLIMETEQGDSTGTYPITIGQSYQVEEFSAANTKSGEWHTVSLELSAKAIGPVFNLVLGGVGTPADVYFDNVRVQTIEHVYEVANTVAAGVGRHIIGTDQAIYSTTGKIADTPFSVEHVAECYEGIAIAGATQVAFSKTGSSWSVHDLSVAQLVAARNSIAAITHTGETYEITAAGPIQRATVSGGAYLARDRRRQRWVAVDIEGKVWVSGDLTSFIEESQQPIAEDANRRSILATDFGRYIGWNADSKDLYYETPPLDWTLGKPLVSPIIDIIEVLE